jgi:hypothetical protein
MPISWANQFEGHILNKIWIPTHYVLSNLCIRFIWVHDVQDTHQKSAFADAKIAFLCTANWTREHDNSGKVCVYYGLIEYTTRLYQTTWQTNSNAISSQRNTAI